MDYATAFCPKGHANRMSMRLARSLTAKRLPLVTPAGCCETCKNAATADKSTAADFEAALNAA